MLQKLSVSKLLYLLLSLFVVGFLFLEIFTFFQTRRVLVKGPTYNQIVQGKDLIADVLPPPEYIIESYLNVLQMTKESDAKKLEALIASTKKLEADFIERHEYWTKELPEGDLKKELLVDSYTPAVEFFALLKNDFIPAIQAKNIQKAEALALGKMNDLYSTHREKINGVVTKANTRNENDEKEGQQIITSTVWTLIILAIVFLLLFTAIFFVILKNVLKNQSITEQALLEATRNLNMVEKSTVNTMMASPDGILTYMNENSRNTLKQLQQYLPDKVENLIGKSIDIFHRNPKMVQQIIKDPRNLPHHALISIGSEKLDLALTAILDNNGHYIGPMVVWNIVTKRINLDQELIAASNDLANAATNVLSISGSLSASAEETSAQANIASVAAEEVNAGVQTVATNMEQMSEAVKEITKTTNQAANMTGEAMRMANNTNQIINKLGESSMDIGNVIKVISSIAQQTNLLALNATIEAARAGEAGKGFAVVANEVKELANQTSKATNEITKKIETIQADSKNAVDAIAEITIAIEKVNGFTGNIASAVEEQAATTNEVTKIITESAEGVKQISENIAQVSQSAASTGKDAGGALEAAKKVGTIVQSLEKYVGSLQISAMDFEVAIKAHRDWKNKLANYFKNPNGSIKVADTCVDNKCSLGKWIYGPGATWNNLDEYNILKSEHAKFHKLAGDLVGEADKGKKLNEEELLGERSAFGKQSDTVIEAIIKVKSKVS